LNRINKEECLIKDGTYRYIAKPFRGGFVQETGTAITKVLPPVTRFLKIGERTNMRESALERLITFFNSFWDI